MPARFFPRLLLHVLDHGEHEEDLLQGGLVHRVVFDLVLLAAELHLGEDLAQLHVGVFDLQVDVALVVVEELRGYKTKKRGLMEKGIF